MKHWAKITLKKLKWVNKTKKKGRDQGPMNTDHYHWTMKKEKEWSNEKTKRNEQ
jgi:hypothetical protein